MKFYKYILTCLILVTMFFLQACQNDAPQTTAVAPKVTTTQPTPAPPKSEESNILTPKTVNNKPPALVDLIPKESNNPGMHRIAADFVPCKTEALCLKENKLNIPELNVSAFISANKKTKDPELGDSHRLFEVKSGPNCEVVFSKTLPINVSADFPYYLSEKAIETNLGLIAIQGFQNAMVYEVGSKKMHENLTPKFLTPREAADATSGMVSNLMFYNQYLLGFALDQGTFIFDMKKNGKAVLPILEKGKNSNTIQLFALEKTNKLYNLVIPIVFFAKDGTLNFKMKQIFSSAVRINPEVNFKLNNNRYILFKEIGEEGDVKYLVVDMDKKERVALPDDVANGNMKGVMNHLK